MVFIVQDKIALESFLILKTRRWFSLLQRLPFHQVKTEETEDRQYETEDRQYRLNYKAERREMINLPPSRLSVKRQKMEF